MSNGHSIAINPEDGKIRPVERRLIYAGVKPVVQRIPPSVFAELQELPLIREALADWDVVLGHGLEQDRADRAGTRQSNERAREILSETVRPGVAATMLADFPERELL